MKDPGYYEKMRDYKNGLWSFMLEHCRILPSGKMRIIFDTDGQDNFEKRVWARYKNVFHREDYEKKQEVINERRQHYLTDKEAKKSRYIMQKTERRIAQKKIKLELERIEKINKLSLFGKFLLKVVKKIK